MSQTKKTFKNIIILGASGVGKSSLVESLSGYLNDYSTSSSIRNMTSTTKAVVYSKGIDIDITYMESGFWGKTSKPETINIKLLDTAGQSRYYDDKIGFLEHELSSGNVDGIMIIHDLSDISSLGTTDQYYQMVSKYATDIPIIDVGNKSDALMPAIRPKFIAHIEKRGKIFSHFDWTETSARTGENVYVAFRDLFRRIFSRPTLELVKNKTSLKSTNLKPASAVGKKREREDDNLEPEQPRHRPNPFSSQQLPLNDPSFESAFGKKTENKKSQDDKHGWCD